MRELGAKTKVLYISPVGARGGAETVLLNIIKYQDRDLYEPIVGLLQEGPLVEEVKRLGVRTIVVPAIRFRNLRSTLRTIRRIRFLLQREQFGLVFGNMPMGHLYGGLAALSTGIPTIWFQHGIPRRFSGVDFAAALVPSKAIFAYTEAARRAQARFSRAGRIVLMPGSVDLARFDPWAVPKGAVRRELGIRAETPLVACVARLQRWKGHSLFLKAAARVRGSLPQARFLVVGGALFGLERGYLEVLQHEAAQLLPPGSVHFLGHRDDMADILSDVDVLVHCPLTPEPFGLVVLEAMAMKVAVVATRAGGLQEIVRHRETGALVPPGNPEALATAVLELLGNASNRKAMGDAGRQRVEERFSAERMVRRIEAVFQEVLGNGSSHY